jgi:hypothetical protein
MPPTTRYHRPDETLNGPTATETVYRALRTLAERLNHPSAPDGLLSARVIGEFSAGKTRLLRELLGEQIPPALFPVSSLERQTRLPLEITYGEPATLELIERANDYDAAVVVQTLDAFPVREELGDYDPQHYRLRLTVPEYRLFLPNGDHYGEDDHESKRLLLIDMPGWNSGQDDIAEGDAAAIMAGYHNLALVFVVNANRLDGQDNHARLRDFLSAFAEADFAGTPTLLIVVTHCARVDRERLSARMRERVMSLWAELDQDAEALCLHLMAVDFAELTPDELSAFRETFWTHLFAPVQQEPTPAAAHPWIASIRHWSGEQDPRLRLPAAAARIIDARALLARACQDGDFLPGMNMHRLLGLDAAAIQARLLEIWRRQLQCPDLEQLAARLAVPAPLADEHPLSLWWNHYWQAHLEQVLAPTRRVFALAERALGEVQPDTPDLREHLAARLSTAHREALQALDSSFTCLVETAQTLSEESHLERAVATLLSLSLLEARYADHYALAKGNL